MTQTTTSPEQASFAVAADSSHAEERSYTLKSDDGFAIFGSNGNMGHESEGYYYRNTRHLSMLRIALAPVHPRLLGVAISDDNATLVCDLAARAPEPNPDMGDDGNEILVRRQTFLWRNAWHDELQISNFSKKAQHLVVRIEYESDFADLFEIRGTTRQKHGAMQTPVRSSRGVTLACIGLDDLRRWTRLRFESQPALLEGGFAEFALELAAGGTGRIGFAIECGTGEEVPKIERFQLARHEARDRRRHWRRTVTNLATGNTMTDAALRRARDDLIMLTTDTPNGPYPYAGVPWFSTQFGRDAIITAMQVLWLAPGLAHGVLSWLAANQATETDPKADAEPGKILHEARDGEMARLGEVPFRRYYGSVDSTPLFVMLAGDYFARTGDLPFIRALWPHVEAALGWIDRYGDEDGDGFVEYGRKSAHGLANQGWKDSQDSIFHQNGDLARGSIALCEVQAYVFAAKEAAAAMALALGLTDRAATLTGEATALRQRFDAAFWDEELQFYVLALDGEKRPCRVLASNAGHTLFAGIALPERADAVIDRLMGADFYSGWGIRTLARGEARYNPMSYHNGSVWPHDNALIGRGFARYGRKREAARLFESMLAAAIGNDRYRLPELFCGLKRRPGQAPTAYPVACSPQAWAAGTLPSLLDACAGIVVDPSAGTAHAVSPLLPASVAALRLDGLQVGDRLVSLELRRGADGIGE